MLYIRGRDAIHKLTSTTSLEFVVLQSLESTARYT